MNKKLHPGIGVSQKAVSTYSLSSKHSGCSPLTPLRDQMFQARFLGQAERREYTSGSHYFQPNPQPKRGRRKLDFDTGESPKPSAAFDAKSKPKRAWTLK